MPPNVVDLNSFYCLHADADEPQNIEQGMMNVEVMEALLLNFI